MTYGWAILIIAIVLVAFFSLNLFNPYTFSPKASPGSCQILRPNGPDSNIFVSAVGPTCTTNEIPQYVARFGATSGCTGTNDYVPIRVGQLSITAASSLSIAWWSNPFYYNINVHMRSNNPAPGGNGVYCGVGNCMIPNTTVSGPSGTLPAWRFSVVTLDSSGNAIYYINGNPGTPASWAGPFTGITYFDIFGYSPACQDWTEGQMANVQIYNTSLSLRYCLHR